VVSRQETNVLPHDRPLALERREHAIRRDRREALDVGVARIQEHIALLVLTDSHAKMVEQLDKEPPEERIRVHRPNPGDHPLRHFAVERVQLQQPVAALFQLRRERGVKCRRFRREGVELRPARRGIAAAEGLGQPEQPRLEPFLVFDAAVQRSFERVQSAMIPRHHRLLRTAGEVGHVNSDRLCLPNPVEPADPLLEQTRIEREVEQHEMMGELKVAALAADLGAHEELRTALLGEPGRVPVTLHQRHAFVKQP
jgi:hypothetical protein